MRKLRVNGVCQILVSYSNHLYGQSPFSLNCSKNASIDSCDENTRFFVSPWAEGAASIIWPPSMDNFLRLLKSKMIQFIQSLNAIVELASRASVLIGIG